MTDKEKLELIIKSLDAKRGEDIQAIKIGDLTILADYFVIVNGTSLPTHVLLQTKWNSSFHRKALSLSDVRLTQEIHGLSLITATLSFTYSTRKHVISTN